MPVCFQIPRSYRWVYLVFPVYPASLFATFSFYPIPNNHLLQNLLAAVLDRIGLDALWVLRFRPLLFGLLLSVTAFFLIRKFSDFITAYLAAPLFSFTSLTLLLSAHVRGYTFTLLAVLAFGGVLQIFFFYTLPTPYLEPAEIKKGIDYLN